MIDAIVDWLASGVPQVPRVRGGIVAGMYRTAPKVTLMLFDEAGDPAVVVKVARDVAAEPRLRAEHEALLRFGPDGPHGAFAPRPHAIGRVAGRLALAEEAFTGRPMTTTYYEPGHVSSRRRVEADFACAGAWLDSFAWATADRAARLGDREIERFVEEPIARYRAEIGWSPEEAALFSYARAAAERMRGERLPLSGVHGDFWMGNLLVTGGRISGVVDWELAREAVPPFRDIYKFPSSYAFYLDRGMGVRGRVPEHHRYLNGARIASPYTHWANAAGFAYAFMSGGWFASLARRWINDRLAMHAIDASFNASFFPVFLAEQAVTLDDITIRAGYRSLVRLLGSGRRASWLLPDHTPTSGRTSAAASDRASHAASST
ncbi:MAG TPA: aminoglycoside phosphotransferase family protein [Actinomycetota bacterium]|nr:aminoglycoside phosphotransferase family protein [Actinomycetota bacterium]